MKRTTTILLVALAIALTFITLGTVAYIRHIDTFPFRCSTFTRYDLSRTEGARVEFALMQDLRFQNEASGYLLLNGQVTIGDQVTTLNRRISLSQGDKIDYDTYRYKIDKIITSLTDNTPDAVFTRLLAELTLDRSYLQLDVVKVDKKAYMIGGPLSYLFTCQRY